MNTTIYFAAALFSLRELTSNIQLTEGLEDRGFRIHLPQRDGFEYSHLYKYLSDKLCGNEIDAIVQNIIYLHDMGCMMANSNIIIANLDEPIDEGVAVEISYAKLMGKYIIGYRTDIRSPYADIAEPLGGTHHFPAYQCNAFIKYQMPVFRSISECEDQINLLTDKIADIVIKAAIPDIKIPEYVLRNPHIDRIIYCAELLFNEITDVHSQSAMQEIYKRYINNKIEFQAIRPVIY
ncbi:MAG: nucleoside 2-deoxyribosyltransferase [Dissulfurispiraceae bacterium]|jgi:nucleoside 2-deoxyribosyltransferase